MVHNNPAIPALCLIVLIQYKEDRARRTLPKLPCPITLKKWKSEIFSGGASERSTRPDLLEGAGVGACMLMCSSCIEARTSPWAYASHRVHASQ